MGRPKGGVPWNKGLTKDQDPRIHPGWRTGLTKETDERIAESGRKSGESRKGREPWNKGMRGTHNPKLSESLKRYFSDPENRKKAQAGDDVTYGAVHMRMARFKTGVCIECGQSRKT